MVHASLAVQVSPLSEEDPGSGGSAAREARTESLCPARKECASRDKQAARPGGRRWPKAARHANHVAHRGFLQRSGCMKVIADLSVVPIGVGVSLSKYVAACERVLRETGLSVRLHAYGTNIEGEWDEVFDAIRRCHEVVHEMGAPRISSTLRIGTRTDRAQTIDDKVRSVENKL